MRLKGGIQIRCTKGFLKKMTLEQKQKAEKMLNNIKVCSEWIFMLLSYMQA